MKKKILVLGLIEIFLAPSLAIAQEATTPLPRSDYTRAQPIRYWLFDRAPEWIRVHVLTTSPEIKARYRLKQARERLAEARKLALRNRTRYINRTLQDYKKAIKNARQFSRKIRTKARQKQIVQLIKTATSRHRKVLEQVKKKVPAQAKPGIERAIKNAKRAKERLVKRLAILKHTKIGGKK